MRSFFSMKAFRIAASALTLCGAIGAASGQQLCPVIVDAQVEVAKGELSLADLLARDTCPRLRRAAARIHLGSAPLAGSARIFEASEVRSLLARAVASAQMDNDQSTSSPVPPRITVRLAGRRASCTDIGRKILGPAERPAQPQETGLHRLAENEADNNPMDCGAADRIAEDSPFELTRRIWNPALGSWDIFARCLHPADCVPFRMRVPDREPSLAIPGSRQPVHPSEPAPPAKGLPVAGAGGNLKRATVVRRGETVTLLWEQDGIRVVIAAICLDTGIAGQRVRARIIPSGREVPAIVVSQGKLRAAA